MYGSKGLLFHYVHPVSPDILIEDQSTQCYIFPLCSEPSSDTVKEGGSVYKEKYVKNRQKNNIENLCL